MTLFEKVVVAIFLSIAGGFAYAGYDNSNFGWWFLSGCTVALTYGLVHGYISSPAPLPGGRGPMPPPPTGAQQMNNPGYVYSPYYPSR